ncbi:disintegrin and metalloproteinase domain-containing protein unc-71-like isoform X1 [Mercenaria mercenaria]|uniref:disintegrin and metalloproteinase domain-containing protein unc-71-like isoform X1 n=1 Tax=Mercenaria mercenaria TaxID=6596 RepID=UPI00234F1877|nr:disintegrin and metalloproteinase domain-containing protein unc-71-like isoform X1 [Mercenaria mercenaria]
MRFLSGYLLVIVIGFIFSEIECSRIKRDVGRLMQEYPFNRFLLRTVPKPFQIVFVKLVKKHSLEPASTRVRKIGHGMYEHLQQVTLQIIIDKKKHKLKLERNDGLFSAGFQAKHFKEQQSQVIEKTVEQCYYQGVVKRDEWSAVAVATCDGIRGLIQLNNETYIIQPLDQGDQTGGDRPHIVYKATSSDTERCGNDHGKWLPFHELHKGEFLRKLKFLNAQRTLNKDAAKVTTKYIKLALVLDNTMYWSLNLTVKQVMEFAIQTTNIVDMYYKELNIRVALTYVELWNRGNRISVSQKLRETLENFMRYQQQHLRGVDHHAAHLLTRRKFEDNTIGMAIPDSVCTGRAGGINSNPSYLEPQKGVTILSHMIGHNLGIKHDEDEDWRYLYHEGGCHCEDDFGCIMSTEVLATPEKHSRMFSSCNVKDWDISLNMGIADCLNKNPQPTFPQLCGNKHVERGEECDCGSPEECARTDPCCDPYTCLLRHWAQCRTGSCCHNCTYLSPDYVCREKSTDCDVPEFCTGKDGQCPSNNYAKDGHSCNNKTGYCMGGICPTLDKQCQHIWGNDGYKAELQCYERFNPTGNFNGHCGKDDSTGSYAKCLPDDIQCGLLHCSGGNKMPLFGPDKDSSKTTFSSNGLEYECKTVHGPSTLDLPNLGLVLDGTKCGDGHVCMNRKCVALSNLDPLNCPGSADAVCSRNGVCTKDDICFCNDGWGAEDCSEKLNSTRKMLSIDMIKTTTTTTTSATVENVKVIPWDVLHSTAIPASTELSSAAVVQAEESGWLNTQWMMIILASVIGGLALILGLSFVCYRRRSPVKLEKKHKKKKYPKDGEESDIESANKLISFGNLPSYKDEKKKKKKKGRKGKKNKKGVKSEDDSDLELPPPPVIISDPRSARPEKGILKGAYNGVKYANERRSSESNTATSSGRDLDSVGPYDEIEEDTEAGEIQDIFSGNSDEPEKSLDALDNMIESSSFDFMLPPPFSNIGLQNRSPSPPRKFTGYDIPMTNLAHAQRPNMWKTTLTSPPKSRVLRMRNLDELLQTIDRNTIDLSPSPDDPPVQISPSTSEDVRSSSTDDRHYPASSHDPQSPNSITSGSTCTALRPLLGSQWSKYVLHRNNGQNGENFNFDDIESPLPHINIPPPMNPINIRSIFNYGQKSMNRDNNDTPLGSQNGECSSNNGTANSRNGYEKSSGYGSEHDPERFSIEDISRNQSRSGSASPPNFSAVIRTGPNQIKLVPAGKYGGYSYNPMDNDLQKLLEGVPRIDAGCYERSPITGSQVGPMTGLSSNTETCSSVTSGTSTLETLKNSVPDYSSSGLNSETNTLVNSEYEPMDLSANSEMKNSLNDSNLNYSNLEDYCVEGNENSKLDKLHEPLPVLANGPFPNPKPLGDFDVENKGSGPCIDRSLEEISQLDSRRNHKKNRDSHDAQRPLSLAIMNKPDSQQGANETDQLMINRYSAIDSVPVDISEC